MLLKSAAQMKKVIEKIAAKHGKLDEFRNREDFHLRIKNDPFMPLVVEKHGNRVSVTHYYIENGDTLPDPDVEFLVRGENWFPIGIQDSFGYSRSLIEDQETREIRVYPGKYTGILRFTNAWARNIRQQGFLALNGR